MEGDGFALLDQHKADRDAAFFTDPPYTLAARRLYARWQIDHRRLFAAMKTCEGDFLMTYDNTPEIFALASSALSLRAWTQRGGVGTKPFADAVELRRSFFFFRAVIFGMRKVYPTKVVF